MPEGRPWDYDEDVDPAAGDEMAVGNLLAGGPEASMRAAGPDDQESLWAKAREAVSTALFGTPERAEAKAAGIGVEMTPAELVEGVGMAASPMLAGPVSGAAKAGVARLARAALPLVPRAVGAVSGGRQGYRVAGPVGAVAGAAMGAARPVATSAASGAVEGGLSGGISGAIGGAALGAVASGGADKVLKIAQLLKTANAAQAAVTASKVGKAVAAAAKPAAEAVKAVSPSVASALPLAERMKASVLMWKNTQKLSGAQIQRFLRETYGKEIEGGMSMAHAGKIRDMILGGK